MARRHLNRSRDRASPACGFTFVWLLLAIAAVGAGAGAVAQAWTSLAQRDREAELLFVGEQYRRAIQSYVDAHPSRVYPRSLDELLLDRRFADPRRHLRRPYPDPFTLSLDWGLIRDAGGITGVHSRSKTRPLKRAGFRETQSHFAQASTHADWQFVAQPGITSGVVSAGQGSGVPSGAQPPGPSGLPVLLSVVTAAPSAASAAAQISMPKNDTAADAQARLQRQCRLIARSDTTTCAAIRASRGDAAGLRCEQAARARTAACPEAGGFDSAMPALVTE